MDWDPVRLVSPADGSTFDYSGSNRLIRTERIHDAITITQLAVRNNTSLFSEFTIKKDYDNASTSLFKESLTLTDNNQNYFRYKLDRGSKQDSSRSNMFYHSLHFALTDMHVKGLQELQPLALETMKFQWLPATQGYEQIEYKIRIVEVLPGQTPEQAMKTGTPIVEKDKLILPNIDLRSLPVNPLTESITMNYGEVTYAWAVQSKLAKDKWGDVMKNNGWSEVRTFKVQRNTPKPRVSGLQTGVVDNPSDTTKPVLIIASSMCSLTRSIG
jgi:hypothetical protein